MDKLSHLLDHWQGHNDEHAENFLKWAEKAAAHGHSETAALLRQAAELTGNINGVLKKAQTTVK